jgi:zinc D-Ala-D-Ala dipeptidase
VFLTGRGLPFFLSCLLLMLEPIVSSQTPPRENGSFRKPELTELIALDPTIKLDIRYATEKNFLGRRVYAQARAFLQRPAALALVRVNQSLRKQGFGLLVFDGYRPWTVTKEFWDSTPPSKRNFVANPAKGSRHNRGCAVDLSMYALSSGEEVEMPGEYDEMTERSSPNYDGGPQESRRLRDLLRAAMEAQGFTVNSYEWWHFDYRDWRKYPILNIDFAQIPSPPKK